MGLLLIVLLAFPLAVSAKDTSYQSLADLLEEVRSPVISSKERKLILDFSRKKMVRMLARDLDTSPKELNYTFIKSPIKATLLLQDPWYDIQTQFYTTLHQENFHQRWLALQKLVKFTEYGKNIYKTMMGHWNYSPVEEGRFYVRWNKFALKKSGKKFSFNVPYFLMSENIQELIEMEAHVPFEDLFTASELKTFVSNTPKMSRSKRQELAEKIKLNQRIYSRAVANSAKTLASIYYLTGTHNRSQTEKRVERFLDQYCENCKEREKKDHLKVSMAYIQKMKESISMESAADVVKSFCSSLKLNFYHWNIDRLKPTPIEILQDKSKLLNYYTIYKLKEKNQTALAKTIMSEDLGALFLTNAINVLDKNKEPVGTRLACTQTSAHYDQQLVLAAIEEAHENIETYIRRLNEEMFSARFDLRKTNSTLDYFVQTNQASTIEAIASFPQGIGWVLKSLAELDQNINIRRKTDKVVSWGGMVLGVGLTLSGFGAPEGVGILLSTAGLIKGVSSGSYWYIRAQQEKAFMQEMRIAKNGSSGLSEDNLKNHMSEYKSLKISYIKEFGMTAFSFTRLHWTALKKSGGDVAEAHTLLEKVMGTAKETGQDEAVDKMEDMILESMVN